MVKALLQRNSAGTVAFWLTLTAISIFALSAYMSGQMTGQPVFGAPVAAEAGEKSPKGRLVVVDGPLKVDSGRLFVVKDTETGREFLVSVYSGMTVTVLPAKEGK